MTGLLDGARALVTLDARASVAAQVLAERLGPRLVRFTPGDLGAGLDSLNSGRPPGGILPVRFRRPAPTRIVLEIDAGAKPATVFVSEAYHPWWRPTVDGRPAPLLRAQMAFIAVPVGPGMHTIELCFEPPWPVRGADAISAATWLGGLLAVGWLGLVRGPHRSAGTHG
jgi:hypothetical protein